MTMTCPAPDRTTEQFASMGEAKAHYRLRGFEVMIEDPDAVLMGQRGGGEVLVRRVGRIAVEAVED